MQQFIHMYILQLFPIVIIVIYNMWEDGGGGGVSRGNEVRKSTGGRRREGFWNCNAH